MLIFDSEKAGDAISSGEQPLNGRQALLIPGRRSAQFDKQFIDPKGGSQ
jgi:hypothetical protein